MKIKKKIPIILKQKMKKEILIHFFIKITQLYFQLLIIKK